MGQGNFDKNLTDVHFVCKIRIENIFLYKNIKRGENAVDVGPNCNNGKKINSISDVACGIF